MQTLKFKAQPTNSIFAAFHQMFGSSSPLPTTAVHCFHCLNSAQRFDYCTLGRSQRLGGAAEHLIDSSESLSFEFKNVIKKERGAE